MMNVLALGLVLTSLVTAGFFTPSPEKQKLGEDVIVKEGHRVVVVEYEKDDGNTKVLISPQDEKGVASKVFDKMAERMENVKEGGKGVASNVYDKMSERMENVKEEGKEVASNVYDKMSEGMENVKEGVKEVSSGDQQIFRRPRELVCDAYGKCKHKIATAMGKTSEASEAVAEKVSEAAGKVKDTVSDTARKTSEKVQDVKENVKESASGIKEEASRKMEGAKENMKESVSEIKEEASRRMEGAKETAKEVKKEGEKELSEILHHAREVGVDVFHYAAERVAPVTGVLHLMGFAAAYGMCVWVTFASSQVLAGALPRQQFGMVQSKVYPVYFRAMAYSVGLALLGHLMRPKGSYGGRSEGWFQGFNLMAALGMVLTNLLYVEPRATKVMLERMKKEKEEGSKAGQVTEPIVGRAPDPNPVAETAGRGSATQEAAVKSEIIRLNETLQRLNSCSSFLNVATLVSLTWHLVHLGARLHTRSCLI